MDPVSRDEGSAPYFDAAGEGRLVARRCSACGHWEPPYQRTGSTVDRCPVCTSDQIEWATAEGRGTLVTWTVIHPKGKDVGNVVGVVELAEGPWMTTALEADPSTLAAGQQLIVGFTRTGGGETVPVFRPA